MVESLKDVLTNIYWLKWYGALQGVGLPLDLTHWASISSSGREAAL